MHAHTLPAGSARPVQPLSAGLGQLTTDESVPQAREGHSIPGNTLHTLSAGKQAAAGTQRGAARRPGARPYCLTPGAGLRPRAAVKHASASPA
jgi:hypothetical protein